MIGPVKIFVLLLLSAILIFSGCTSTRPGPYFDVQEGAFEKDGEDFIELNDGKILTGKITKDNLSNGKGHLTMNNTKYPNQDIRSYQDDKTFFKKNVYGGFNERIIKGKINMYRYVSSSSIYSNGKFNTTYRTTYFMQKGAAGDIVIYDINELKNMVGDHQLAVDELSKYEALTEKQKRTQGNNYLVKVIAVYNKNS